MGEKTVGVIGGLGPEATVDLMRRVIRATPALDDIDHIRMVVDNNPKVPSRIKALIDGTGENPAPVMAEMARKLAEWGVDFLVIPCNTAHHYLEEISSAVDIPVLDMVEMTVERVHRENPELRRVGLLASTAVLMTGLYMRRFRERGIEMVYPSEETQEGLMEAIRRVKRGRFGGDEEKVLLEAARELLSLKAGALIVACTELSILSDALEGMGALYDASQVLAEGIVAFAKGE